MPKLKISAFRSETDIWNDPNCKKAMLLKKGNLSQRLLSENPQKTLRKKNKVENFSKSKAQ